MIKPSEITPRFSGCWRELIGRRFSADECAVVTGDADTGRDFVRLPFNHLFFTGSTAVGRKVALAAAANLTPVTLELGGKSPVIVDASCDLRTARARSRPASCSMPARPASRRTTSWCPTRGSRRSRRLTRRPSARCTRRWSDNPDYTSIVNDRHYARLQALVAGSAAGRRAGADDQSWRGRKTPARRASCGRRCCSMSSGDMRGDAGGDLRPAAAGDAATGTLDEAIAFVNASPRPLALYWFGRATAHREQVLRETRLGRRHGQRRAAAHRAGEPALRRCRRQRHAAPTTANTGSACSPMRSPFRAIEAGRHLAVAPALRQARSIGGAPISTTGWC